MSRVTMLVNKTLSTILLVLGVVGLIAYGIGQVSDTNLLLVVIASAGLGIYLYEKSK